MTDNRYTANPAAEEIIEVQIVAAVQLGSMTVHHEPDTTFRYLLLVSACLCGVEGQTMESGLSALWVLSRVVSRNVEPKPGGDVFSSECGDPECEADHAAESAFLEAAARGAHDAAVNVGVAVYRAAKGKIEMGQENVADLFAGVLMRLAVAVAEMRQGEST